MVVVGDALLDRDVEGSVERLAPDAPVPVVEEREVCVRPGGAGLAALLAARGGRDVTLVTALGDDRAGVELRAALESGGVDVVDLGLRGATPEKVRVRSGGRSLLRLDRGGGAAAVGALSAAGRAAIEWAGVVLVADYGRGIAAEPTVREALSAIAGHVPVVWDPHSRGPAPVPGVALVTPNADEAAHFASEHEGGGTSVAAARAVALARRWRAQRVCVTRGGLGALVAAEDGTVMAFPAEAIAGGDSCGAGDRFASRAAELLADGADVLAAVAGAVAAATTFVEAGGAASVRTAPYRAGGAATSTLEPSALAATPPRRRGGSGGPQDAADVVARTRAAGGVVVATGGCFDLLHTGHVRTLEAARELGDCLVVLLNSDASVKRLKGPARPVVGEQDRAAVLRALRCVDAVLVFEQDTPVAALERVRPDIWVKGGDYAVEDLPEADAVASWDGRIVLLPYLDGRSTTKLIQEAAVRAV
ncbi:MAG: D-glycero-beta-D-manno-heptose 1-phosphate adenylyltransferase [Actinobacteria bacterium]|nr:D-glycero-beta-D-manno-heptose 1-phosphate adenylyltransferase [Actinomycetota bacterium]